MHFVYIIYSKNKDTFYTGETSDLENRMMWHNTGKSQKAYTRMANDWEIVYSIICIDNIQAKKIEKHIKAMKSRTYIQNLIKYPEIAEKLKIKYLSSAG